MSQQQIKLDQFSPQQLYQLKQGFEGQLNTLGQSMQQFRFAMDKYEEGKRAIKAAQDCRPNEQMLIPLSNSLYIEGVLDNLRNGQRMYLIQYGAGFFVECNAKDSVQFYQRKINMIKQKTVKLQQLINQKRQAAKQCEMRIMAYVQQQQQQPKKQ